MLQFLIEPLNSFQDLAITVCKEIPKQQEKPKLATLGIYQYEYIYLLNGG